MARIRSPNYPGISLPEAIQRVKEIHGEEQHLAADKGVIAKHLGYGGLNGASLKVISALGKYGLLEEVQGDKLRVSKLALAILFPENENRKADAIREAASKPALFGELLDQWEGEIPSDANLQSYLIRRNFAQSAIDKVIKSFRETMDLITPQNEAYDSSPPYVRDITGVEKLMEQSGLMPPPGSQKPPPPSGMRVSIVDDCLEVNARLTDTKSIDRLIQILNANKILLEPVYVAFATEYTDDEEGRKAKERDRLRPEESVGPAQSAQTQAGMSFMITQDQRNILEVLGYAEDAIKQMTPDEAHRILQLNKKASD